MKEVIKTENIVEIKENELMVNSLIPLNTENEEFNMLMELYHKASLNVLENLKVIKDYLQDMYEYNVINNITYRIKSKTSIINKMYKKHYEVTYKNLIEKINDIAGIRVVCAFKNDISKVVNIIFNIPNTKVVKVKDYLKTPKKGGYSGYHIILETLVKYEGDYLPIKVEIQIRTMAMDFWSTTEHKLKYKTTHQLSKFDSKKLEMYAKIINLIDDKIMNLYKKQEERKIKFRRTGQ